MDLELKDFAGGLELGQIIPQEEPKQEKERSITITHIEARANSYIDFAKSNEDVSAYSFVAGWNKGAKWQQENSNINALDFEIDSLKREIKVLRHQQERSYSEEEVIQLLNDYHKTAFAYTRASSASPKEWFEQFKKK